MFLYIAKSQPKRIRRHAGSGVCKGCGMRRVRKFSSVLALSAFLCMLAFLYIRIKQDDDNYVKAEVTFLTEMELMQDLHFRKTVSAQETFRNETRHLFFLKVHKAASTTISNIILRFAMSRQLNVMLPTFGTVLSFRWIFNASDLSPGVPFFDILCSHLVEFQEMEIRKHLHPDAIFIGIVRHPLDVFRSAFHYYREMYKLYFLKKIPGPFPISTYLKTPWVWDSTLERSLTHNTMSYDFGMDMLKAHDETYVTSYTNYVNQIFSLVLLAEKFDESVIMMRRLLGWNLQDVLYFKSNVLNKTSYNITDHNFTDDEKFIHRAYNGADYALYKTFSDIFLSKLNSQPQSFFKEVDYFRHLLKEVEQFCLSTVHFAMKVGATEWNKQFIVSRDDCKYMSMNEMKFLTIIKSMQQNRTLTKTAN